MNSSTGYNEMNVYNFSHLGQLEKIDRSLDWTYDWTLLNKVNI